MATLTVLSADVRTLLQEPTQGFFLDTEITRWINLAIRDFSSKVLWYSRESALAVVASVIEYTIPADALKLEIVRWKEELRLRKLDPSKWSALTYRTGNTPGVEPRFYFAYPHDKRIALYPRPSVSSAADQLNGAINTSVTTITVDDTTGFPSQGYILIDSEQVRYSGITATDFLNCRRGDGDTTPANHLDNAVVTHAPLVLSIRALPPDLSAGADVVKLPEAFADAISLFAAARGEMKRKNWDEAQRLMALYRERRAEAMAERNEESIDEGPDGVKDEEFDLGYLGDDI